MNKHFLLVAALMCSSPLVIGHGDVTPQGVNVEGLPDVEGELTVNPYRGNEKAIEVGDSAYNQNCARCHGLGGVSGGIAPDLRYLPPGEEGDEYYAQKVRNGVIRNGMTYMPAFSGVFPEEAIWAIRTWLDSVYTEE
jgi:cytochrome c-550 PedF